MNRVALLIPHYNNPQGLAASLASVGADECVDAFVVDDGSTRAPLDEAFAVLRGRRTARCISCICRRIAASNMR